MKDEQELFIGLDDLFLSLIRSQERRVRRAADRLQEKLTDDDLLQPHDIPALRDSPDFNYEDGTLAGIRSAQIAVRVKLLELLSKE